MCEEFGKASKHRLIIVVTQDHLKKKNVYIFYSLYRGWVTPPLPPSSGRDCRSVPANFSHAANSRLSRARGESSPPCSRVGTAAGPDLTFDIEVLAIRGSGQTTFRCPRVGTATILDSGFIPRQICFVCLEPGTCPLTSFFRLSAARVGLPVPSAGCLHLDHVSTDAL